MNMRWTCGSLVAAALVCGCGGGTPVADPGTAPAAGSQGGPAEAADAEQGPPPEQPREALPPQSEPAITPDTQPAAAPTGGDSQSTAPTATPGAIMLALVPWEEVQKHIAAQQGKVVVVDLWATYCVPCRESFPGLVALSKLDPENIVCLSVSLDDPEDAEKKDEALAFLNEQQAQFANFLCTTDTDKLYNEILQIGGIPAVYVYGRDGQLAKLFNGPTPEGTDHTYDEHITPFVKELAAAK